MSKDVIIILFAIWVAVLPFLGFPDSWDTVMYVVSGLSIVLLMVLLRREIVSYLETVMKQKTKDVYIENEKPKAEKPRPPRVKKEIPPPIPEPEPEISLPEEIPPEPEPAPLVSQTEAPVIPPKRTNVRRKKISVHTEEPTA